MTCNALQCIAHHAHHASHGIMKWVQITCNKNKEHEWNRKIHATCDLVKMHFGMKRTSKMIGRHDLMVNTIILSSLATFNTSHTMGWNHLDEYSSHAKKRVCSAAPDDHHHDDVPQIEKGMIPLHSTHFAAPEKGTYHGGCSNDGFNFGNWSRFWSIKV